MAIGLSALVIAVIVGAVAHKRRSYTMTYNKFEEEDFDDNLSGKVTVDDTLSHTSSGTATDILSEEASIETEGIDTLGLEFHDETEGFDTSGIELHEFTSPDGIEQPYEVDDVVDF